MLIVPVQNLGLGVFEDRSKASTTSNEESDSDSESIAGDVHAGEDYHALGWSGPMLRMAFLRVLSSKFNINIIT